MLDYMFSQHTKNGTLPKNPLVIKSIVTSPLQNKITHHYGGTIMDTLTGFKWMAHLWRELEESGTNYTYFFASEESFGYMPGNFVRDKDAITSMALMNEIVLLNKLQDKTLIDALADIYEKLGYAQESLIALTFEGLSGRDTINSIMKYFREEIGSEIANEKVLVKKDYDSLKSVNLQTNESIDINMEKSNVLGFEFESGNILYVRPSGTEPKIKFYTMVNSTKDTLDEKKMHAKEMINTIESFIHQKLDAL
jgi:phosphoglucomutase